MSLNPDYRAVLTSRPQPTRSYLYRAVSNTRPQPTRSYLHVGEDGGADEVSVVVSGHLDAASVQEALGALADTGLDQLVDARLGLGGDDRAEVGVRLVTCPVRGQPGSDEVI